MNFKKNYFNGVNLSFIKNLPAGSNILDYGCGQGELTVFLVQQGYKVLAADIESGLETIIRKELTTDQNKNLSFVTIKNENKPLPDKVGPFDAIILREVLEHLPNPKGILVYLAKLLSNKGILIFSVPSAFTERYFTWWDRDWLKKSQHLNVFSKSSVTCLLKETSLELMAVEGQNFRWTLLWSLLAPFQVDHKMGDPLSHRRLVRICLFAVKLFSSIPFCEFIGSKVFPKSYFFYAKKYKPRVLVIYDYHDWILGKWATNIMRIFSDDYNIIAMSMFHAYQNKKYVMKLIDKVDLLHILLPHCFKYFHDISPRKPVISTIHHWVEWSELYSLPAFNSQRIVTVSGQWKEKLIEKGIASEKINVVHSGVDDRFFVERKKLIPKSAKLTIGFFAKYDSNEYDRKGSLKFQNLITYIASIRKQNLFRIIIAGPGWRKYIAKVNEHNIETIYLDYVDDEDMPALYRSLDVYLMLSDVEGGPVTIAEAMASMCLVFSTKIGLAQDIIINNVNGILINNSDYDDIYNKLIYYFENEDKREDICVNAFNFAKENMSFNKTFQPLRSVYEEVLSSVKNFNTKHLDIETINIKNRKFSKKVEI